MTTKTMTLGVTELNAAIQSEGSQESLMPADGLALMKQNAAEAARLMKALGNDSRLLILCYLGNRELSVTELNSFLDLSQSALSQHLALLRRDGLVKTRRESQTIYYSLQGDKAKRLIGTLHDIYCPAL